jgi:hypothetical protein
MALFGEQAETELFEGMQEKDWENLLYLASQQGVPAIAFDGAMRLPALQQPPFSQRVPYGLYIEQTEKKYRLRETVAEELAGMFGKAQVRMLLFKGLSLSVFYPIPAHREFSDIDIYLFGQHQQGDRLLENAEAKRKKLNYYKHTVSYYKEVMIENHAHLLNVRSSKKIDRLEKRLLEILSRDKRIREGRPGEILFPPPDFSALFFMTHALQHFSAGALRLRTFCDWAVFLRANRDKIDFNAYRNSLQEAGILALADAISVLTQEWLKQPDLLPAESNPQLEAWLRAEVEKEPYPPCRKSSAVGVLCYKLKHFLYKYKYERIVFKRSFFSRVIDSVVSHLRHPSTILKFN